MIVAKLKIVDAESLKLAWLLITSRIEQNRPMFKITKEGNRLVNKCPKHRQ